MGKTLDKENQVFLTSIHYVLEEGAEKMVELIRTNWRPIGEPLDSTGVDFRLIGAERKSGRKFRPRNRIDYKVLVMWFVKSGNQRMANLAREAARRANQITRQGQRVKP